MDKTTEGEQRETKTLYLYTATAKGKHGDYLLFLYAEDEEQAQEKVKRWWEESCEREPFVAEEYTYPTIEKQTTLRRGGNREYEPVLVVPK